MPYDVRRGRRRARLVAGAGGLSEPKLPDIEGIDTFAGELFHSARWDHDVDLTGKRVAVIGTGASAIQIVPEIAAGRRAPRRLPAHRAVGHPAQRPRLHRARAARAAHVPGARSSSTAPASTGRREGYVPGVHAGSPRLAAPAEKAALDQHHEGDQGPRAAREGDADLRDRLQAGADLQRLLPRARRATNVDLVTDRIARVTADRRSSPRDGTERQVDVLVVATGFYTTELPIAERIVGRDGPHARRARGPSSGMAAYKGTTVPGFPNLFLLVGPNTGLGHSSMVFMIESQVAYIRDALRTHARSSGTPRVEPRADGQRRVERRPAAPDEAHRVEHRAAARAGTSTPTAATPRCGRARRSRSAGCWPASTPRRTTYTRRTPTAKRSHEDVTA